MEAKVMNGQMYKIKSLQSCQQILLACIRGGTTETSAILRNPPAVNGRM